jgi:hypothetical protein
VLIVRNLQPLVAGHCFAGFKGIGGKILGLCGFPMKRLGVGPVCGLT